MPSQLLAPEDQYLPAAMTTAPARWHHHEVVRYANGMEYYEAGHNAGDKDLSTQVLRVGRENFAAMVIMWAHERLGCARLPASSMSRA